MSPAFVRKPARLPIAQLKKRLVRLDPGTEDELKALAASWLADPLHPILVRAADLAVGDGNRRLLGLEHLGEAEVDVELIEGDIPDSYLDRMALVTAYHRAPLGGYEQAHLARSIKEGPPPLSNKELAAALNMDQSMPTRLLSLFDCIPEVQEAAKAGDVGVTDWYPISRDKDQHEALRLKLDGASRSELESRVKRPKSRGENKPSTDSTTRPARPRNGKPNGTSTTVNPVVRSTDAPPRCAVIEIPHRINLHGEDVWVLVTISAPPGMLIDLNDGDAILKETPKVIKVAQGRGWNAGYAQTQWAEAAERALMGMPETAAK